MKSIFIVFILCTVTNANAGMYKCISDGKTSYQSSPCPRKEDENEFSLKFDLPKEQIQQAIDKKTAELEAESEQKRLDKMAYDKERMIQAEEIKALEATLQTDAMRERNNIEHNKYNEAARHTDALRDRNYIELYQRNNAVHIEYEEEHLKKHSLRNLPSSSNQDYLKNKKTDKNNPIRSQRSSRVLVIVK